MTMLIRPDVADRVRSGIGMAVSMTVKAGNTLMGLQAATVFCGVELLLGKRRNQQAQSFELFGIEHDWARGRGISRAAAIAVAVAKLK